jgi:hypothetical protein
MGCGEREEEPNEVDEVVGLRATTVSEGVAGRWRWKEERATERA